MTPRRKSAILWGAVGALTFLVALQGYALAAGPLVSVRLGGTLALAVGITAGLAAYVTEHRIAAWAARRAREDDDPSS